MKTKRLHIVILFLIPLWINAQPKSITQTGDFIDSKIDKLDLYSAKDLKEEKIYRIWFDDYQVIELVENENMIVNGSLINYVTKIDKNENKNRIISQKLTIPEHTAKELFEKFKTENIELIHDCREIEGYVLGCDGNSVTFEIKTPSVNRAYFYWEPENDNYQNSTNINVHCVRQILICINKEINRSLLFKNFTDRLGIGKYRYGMIILTKK